VYETEEGIEHPVGVSFGVNYLDKSSVVNIRGTIGVQHVYANLAAIAVGLREGFELSAIVEALNKHETPPGRMKILKGLDYTTIIDDSYNSSPVAVREALETLRDLRVGVAVNAAGTPGAKKIAILGDMLELGTFSVAEHKAVGEKVAGIASVLLTVGVRARVIRESAIANGMNAAMAISFDDSRKAGEYARSMLTPGDVILIKGSQGTLRMERAVEEIMVERGKKSELLVRQEPEWQKR
jgi:UDP-N-acetylmuramoyl-tripeptide--D-alanyl-D-alanine ligase